MTLTGQGLQMKFSLIKRGEKALAAFISKENLLHDICCLVWFIQSRFEGRSKGDLTCIYFLLGTKHEPDGRVIIAEFESLRILNTYVPNNGWKEEESSFQRRRKWDKKMLEFVLQNSDKTLIWCGDLNVRYVSLDC